MNPHPHTLALAADMIFAAKIKGAATATQTPLTVARTPAHLVDLATQSPPPLIILDLDTRALEIPQTLAALKAAAPQAHILAFVSHVNTDKIKEARDAGAHQILARSAFTQTLPQILQSHPPTP